MNRPNIGNDLDEYLAANAHPDVARVLIAIARASLPLIHLIRRGRLAGALDAATGAEHDGFGQRALDVFADEALVNGLKGVGVRGVVSEERADPVAIDADGTLLVAIDPLDGSSNIDANISIGTFFSVLNASPGELKAEHFLQPGINQRAAGFIIYGPHVALVFTTGAGVCTATLDPDSNHYRISNCEARIPPEIDGIRNQRLQLKTLAAASARLFRGLPRGGGRSSWAQFQHAVGRLDGGGCIPDPDSRRRLSLSRGFTPRLRARTIAPSLRSQSSRLPCGTGRRSRD